MAGIHGGDIYGNHVKTDFSVNINPLGIPEEVGVALRAAIGCCNTYPDIEARELRRAVSRMLSVPGEYLLFGNGASELFMAAVHGIKPQKTGIPVPSFYGYEHAAKVADGEIIYYEIKPGSGFGMIKDIDLLKEDVDLLFLANPNNPTGTLIDKKVLTDLLQRCRERGIYVILDECFIEFCGREYSMISETERFDNLILVRAFTKIFSIPGVRLGYLVCSDRALLRKIKRQLPEWNLSVFAQAAGLACTKQTDFITETAGYIRREREFLEEGLKKMGLRVFPSATNYILFYSDIPFYEKLLEKGILIRDCANFRGLCKGYYRIAVRNREENEKLLTEMADIGV